MVLWKVAGLLEFYGKIMKYKNTNLRLYAFCNFYLNSISQGIQTAHVVGRMAKYYRHSDTNTSRLFWAWLDTGKQNETIIVCNGGMGADISEAYHKHENTLTAARIPSGIFYEEIRAFGTNEPAPTCWACVLPEEIYGAKLFPSQFIGDKVSYNFNFGVNDPSNYECNEDHPIFDFLQYKNSCGLAR